MPHRGDTTIVESCNPGRGLEEWPVNDSTAPAASLLGAVEDLPRKKPGSAADADECVGDSSHICSWTIECSSSEPYAWQPFLGLLCFLRGFSNVVGQSSALSKVFLDGYPLVPLVKT
jgi:hypothetical protein